MGHVAIVKTAQYVDNCRDTTDMTEELIAQPLAPRCAAYKTCDIYEFEIGRNLLRRSGNRKDLVKSRIGHRDTPNIWFNRTERIVRRFRQCGTCQSVEQSRFADIG